MHPGSVTRNGQNAGLLHASSTSSDGLCRTRRHLKKKKITVGWMAVVVVSKGRCRVKDRSCVWIALWPRKYQKGKRSR